MSWHCKKVRESVKKAMPACLKSKSESFWISILDCNWRNIARTQRSLFSQRTWYCSNFELHFWNMKHDTLNTQLTSSVEVGVGFFCVHGVKYAQRALPQVGKSMKRMMCCRVAFKNTIYQVRGKMTRNDKNVIKNPCRNGRNFFRGGQQIFLNFFCTIKYQQFCSLSLQSSICGKQKAKIRFQGKVLK